MRLPDDDEIYEVDNTYLGPPGRTIGRYRYRAIGLGVVLVPLYFVIMRQVGVPFTMLSVGLSGLFLWRLISWLADHATYERPVGTVMSMMWTELNAPRERDSAQESGGLRFNRHDSWRQAIKRGARKASGRRTKSASGQKCSRWGCGCDGSHSETESEAKA